MEPLVLGGERPPGEKLVAEVARLAETDVRLCYQCGKCSAGCPVSPEMDRPPHQLMRLLQLGQAEEALTSEAIWLCTSCQTCSSRCPRGVRVADVLEALRWLAANRATGRIPRFHRAFVASVRSVGRLDEPRLLLRFPPQLPDIRAEVGLGVRLLSRRRLGLPKRAIRGVDGVRRLFSRKEAE